MQSEPDIGGEQFQSRAHHAMVGGSREQSHAERKPEKCFRFLDPSPALPGLTAQAFLGFNSGCWLSI